MLLAVVTPGWRIKTGGVGGGVSTSSNRMVLSTLMKLFNENNLIILSRDILASDRKQCRLVTYTLTSHSSLKWHRNMQDQSKCWEQGSYYMLCQSPALAEHTLNNFRSIWSHLVYVKKYLIIKWCGYILFNHRMALKGYMGFTMDPVVRGLSAMGYLSFPCTPIHVHACAAHTRAPTHTHTCINKFKYKNNIQ